MAYDTARGRTVLFGGYGSNGGFSDTWEYDGGTWVEVSTEASPPGGSGRVMVYDSGRSRVVLVAYSGGSMETWEYDGVQWIQVSTDHIISPARYAYALTYDSTQARTILFGGQRGSFPGTLYYYNDHWEYDGVDWTEKALTPRPSSRSYSDMAYDSLRRRSILFSGQGGWVPNDTWEYDGATWTEADPATSPSKRVSHRLAFDSRQGRTILFGGGYVKKDDTWAFDGTDWLLVDTADSPSARDFHGMVYDVARGRIVLFGGKGDTGYLADTWEYTIVLSHHVYLPLTVKNYQE